MGESYPPGPPRPKRDVLSVLGMVAVAGAAAFTSYSGLDGLARLAGWPGQLAMLLPVTIDAYAMTATRVWLSPARLTRKARAWARGNAIGAIATSVLGNTIFHAAAAHVLSVTWPVVVGISAIPSVVLGLTVHLWHVADDLEPEPEAKQSPGPAVAEPETVHAAYPILGGQGVPAIPATGGGTPGTRATGTPRTAAGTGGARTRSTSTRAAGRATEPVPKADKAQRDAELLAAARQLDQRTRAQGKPGVGVRQLKNDLHIGQDKAYELLQLLTADAAGPGAVPETGAAPASPDAPDARRTSVPAQPGTQVRTSPRPEPGAPDRPQAPAVPAPTQPSTPRTDPAPAVGPVSPSPVPEQRAAPVEHANGASVEQS